MFYLICFFMLPVPPGSIRPDTLFSYTTLFRSLDAYLSACQLCITLASLGLGWVGEPAFSRLVAPLLHQFGVQSPEVIHNTSVAIAFGLISFLHIVLGELAPKSIAIQIGRAACRGRVCQYV